MLLRTRFYLPPLREQAVIRRLLIDSLKRTAGGSLIVVSAPAGYGKTTLVSQWLHLHPHTFAWLTLDREHNHPTQFWQYVITALHQVQPEIGVMALEQLMLQSNGDPTPVLVTLLNDLDRLSIDNRSKEPMTLVWDDFHLIKDAQVLRLCNLLLDHLPSSLRIVVTAREAPALALARRRASGQLIQIDIDALRFNAEESQRFFNNTMALPLTPNLTASLCNKTEGWIAGLQLAALSLQRKPDEIGHWLDNTGIDRHIADYLLEEVFAGLEPELQMFLLHAALPRRFCAGLMNAMLSRAGAQETLLTLDNHHLFLVALDNHRAWFRFHDLFRQFLLQRLQLGGGIDVTTAAGTAIQWLENNGYQDDAIELSLDRQLFSETSRLLHQYRLLNDTTEGHTRASLWENRLPPSHSVSVATTPRPSEQASTIETPVEPLTLQEKRVLELISLGLPNKTIAEKLHISTNTLKVHIRNLYGKMGVESRTQALLKAKSP